MYGIDSLIFNRHEVSLHCCLTICDAWWHTWFSGAWHTLRYDL